MASVNCKEQMVWIPWSEKSADIPFKTTNVGVGDGEVKVSVELDTSVLGQNSDYDMGPVCDGIKVKCDVKKLDTQNDFNTGVKGRNALRPIKQKYSTLLEAISTIRNSPELSSTEQEKLTELSDVTPDELALGNLQKISVVCVLLHEIQTKLRSKLPFIQPFTDVSGPVPMPLDIYHMFCEKMGRPFPDEYSEYIECIRVLQHLDHCYVREPSRFMDDLNGLADVFKDVTIIIVHEKKGYMFIDNKFIRFLRITRGHPRFQVLF